MREAGNCAEEKASKKINKEHADKSIAKLNQFHMKDSAELADDEQIILSLIKKNSGKKIGELFKTYQDKRADVLDDSGENLQ